MPGYIGINSNINFNIFWIMSKKSEILDNLSAITRMANRMRNKYPDIFSENDKKLITICQDIMSKNASIKENEKFIKSNKS